MTQIDQRWPYVGDEMAGHIRAFDWGTTALGPITAWSERLRLMVEQVLASPFVSSLACGPERLLIYNDAAAKLYGVRHPAALGHPHPKTFPEGWATVAPFYERAFAGETVQVAGQPLDTSGEGGAMDVFDALLTPVHETDARVAFVHMIGFEIGARARGEAALRASEVRHRLLIESWAQAVWETNAAGSVVTDSPSWRAYTGQTLEEWLGYGWLDAIHPDDRAYAERQWREAVASRGLVDAEFRLRAPEGRWRWTNVRAAPVLDARGSIEKWVGANIDIDARKRAEAALRESETRYRALFESMDEAYAVVEVLKDRAGAWIDFRFIEVNPAFVVHTSMPWPVGKTATELLGSPNPRWTQLYGQALDTGAPIRVEENEPTLGHIFDLNIFALDRARNRVAVLFTNITARKTVEAALRESEAQFRALADAAPALIWRNDAKGENLFSNRRFSEFTGKSAKEIRGEGWHALVHPDEVEDYVSDYLAAVRERKAWQNRTRIRRYDGQWRTFENYAQPLFSEDGSYLGHVGVSVDVTASFEAEAALRESEERQAFLLKLSDALRAEPNPDAVANRALQLLFDHLRLDRCYITYYRPADDAADFPYQLGNDTVPPLPAEVRLSDFPDAYEQVLDRTFVIEDDFERRGLSQAERASSKALGMRAMVASTIRRGERTPLCSMAAVSSRPRRWSPAEIALVEETAERTWAAVEYARAEMRVRGSEERLRQFGEASSDVLWIRDAETLQWTYLTLSFETIYGLARENSLRGDNMAGWLDMIVPDDRPHAIAAIDRVRVGERVSFEYRIQQPDGGAVRWLRNTDFPIRDAVGKLRWLGGVGRDITEEKAAIQRQEVLVNELQHRSRNLLGVVTAVAGKTLRQGGSVDAFEERLQALSRAQALLSQAGSDMVEVGALVRAELAAHIQGGSERVRASGPKVQLTARQVQNFALALHELTTNAVKYGALRDASGWLAVTWEIVLDQRGRRRLALSWIESGVAIDPAKATHRGYGTELIQEALSYALGADVDYELSADGVRCRIEMPINQPE